MDKSKLTPADNAIYYIMLILTLGGVYFWKVIAKKAMSEMIK